MLAHTYTRTPCRRTHMHYTLFQSTVQPFIRAKQQLKIKRVEKMNEIGTESTASKKNMQDMKERELKITSVVNQFNKLL